MFTHSQIQHLQLLVTERMNKVIQSGADISVQAEYAHLKEIESILKEMLESDDQ